LAGNPITITGASTVASTGTVKWTTASTLSIGGDLTLNGTITGAAAVNVTVTGNFLPASNGKLNMGAGAFSVAGAPGKFGPATSFRWTPAGGLTLAGSATPPTLTAPTIASSFGSVNVNHATGLPTDSIVLATALALTGDLTGTRGTLNMNGKNVGVGGNVTV